MKEHRKAIVYCQTGDEMRGLLNYFNVSEYSSIRECSAPIVILLNDNDYVTFSHNSFAEIAQERESDFWGNFEEYMEYCNAANISIEVSEYL